MSDTPQDKTSVDVRQKHTLTKIWIIPIVAIVLGVWMLLYDYTNRGPSFQIYFDNADNLEAGKTKIKFLSVDVGLVEAVDLKKDISGVIVNASLEKKYAHLLKADTQFWVERARVDTGGVTGLDTILKGAHIKLLPGKDEHRKRTFTGLESPPLTDPNAPGVRLVLESDNASAASTGDNILFNGFVVGRVESQKLDEASQMIKYDVFIRAPYHQLVTRNVRFWDVSGISMQASARGFSVNMGSLDTLLTGGLAFTLPPGIKPGPPVEDGTEFKLYESLEKTLERTYKQKLRYVIAFREAVGGLRSGAPVVYRGIPVGEVERILFEEMVANRKDQPVGSPIPVLIALEPGRLQLGDTPEAAQQFRDIVQRGVPKGLRATLKTGNLISGSQMVSLDYYPEEPQTQLGQFLEYPLIPTAPGSLAQLQQQASDLLNKFNELPLEATVGNANNAIDRLDQSLQSLNQILQSRELQQLPNQLNQSLQELDTTLQSFKSLSERLNTSAELLPVRKGSDIQPLARPSTEPSSSP